MTREDTAVVGRTIRERTAALDVGLLVAVPVVLVATMALPRATRTSLAFEYADPSPWTAFASSFVHLGVGHLLVNLLGYVLVTALGFFLSVLSGHRRRFRVVLVSLVLVCPIVLPYLNLTIVRRTATLGFSGVVMALYGYLPVAIGTVLEDEFDFRTRGVTAPLLFFLGLTLVTGLTLGAVLRHPVSVPVEGRTVPVTSVLAGTLSILLLALALVVVLYALSVGDAVQNVRETVTAILTRPGYAELLVAGVGVFVAVPLATFPIDPVVDGGVLNLYTHLLGYALGFIGTYVSIPLERAIFEA